MAKQQYFTYEQLKYVFLMCHQFIALTVKVTVWVNVPMWQTLGVDQGEVMRVKRLP